MCILCFFNWKYFSSSYTIFKTHRVEPKTDAPKPPTKPVRLQAKFEVSVGSGGGEINYSRLPLWENLLVLFFFQIFKLKVISMFCGRTEDRIEVLSVWEGEKACLIQSSRRRLIRSLVLFKRKMENGEVFDAELEQCLFGIKKCFCRFILALEVKFKTAFWQKSESRSLLSPVSCREVKRPGASLF